MRNTVRFVRNGRVVELPRLRPDQMLLDYLRQSEGATGTKEGCGEGDCGACTVALGRLSRGRLVYEPVNACIFLAGQADGAEVVAIEDIAEDDGTLHPLQHAMVDLHASQCGFCTPGFVMALFCLYHHTSGPVDRGTVNDWIAGNLCRCTGYRPIVDAAVAACSRPRGDRHFRAGDDTLGLLSFLADRDDILVGDDRSFFAAPVSLDTACALYERHPDAVIVAGATDVGLWITKKLQDIPKIIHLGRIAGLDRVEDTGAEILIGAAATYATAERHLRGIDPDLGELVRRIGGKQVRASGTVGGNIANGSPIGDTPPALIALGSTIELRKGQRSRTLPLEDFFLDYGKQDRARGELLTGILVPKLAPGQVFRCYKVSKRFDQDISAVMGAFSFTLSDGHISEARIAFGGMAATPKRAREAEAALSGIPIRDSNAWAGAFTALRNDFKPIDDLRASARYRTETAQALLGKALIEVAGTSARRTRVVGHREAVSDGSG
jgi:xanthine dehydrogenase small subunit